MPETIAVIGCRTGDPSIRIIAGSEERECKQCEHSVVLSPASLRRLSAADIVLCVPCAVMLAKERGRKWVDAGRNADQLRELEANGYRPEQFLRRHG